MSPLNRSINFQYNLDIHGHRGEGPRHDGINWALPGRNVLPQKTTISF